MKIAVVAAAGRSGRAFVQAALDAGHDVTAGVRGTNPFADSHHLRVVTCDATNRSQVEDLIRGQDAVVSLIGHVKGSPAHVQSLSTQTIIAVMHEYEVKRLVSLTGTGVRVEGDHIGLIDRLANTAINLIDPDRIRDGQAHVGLIEKSDLEWTIVRVLKLQNSASQPFRLTGHGPTKLLVGRSEVAEAILQVLRDESFIRQLPMISRP